jgi:sarcosine oxidase
VLDPGAVARRFPRLRIPDGTLACLLPDAGFLDADLCVAELLATATRHGATVHAPAPALHLDLGGRRPVVVGADRAWRCESLVLAPGPWAPRLLADTGWPLRPTLQYTCYFEPASPGRYGPGELPVLGDRTTGNYSFPRHGPGIKAAVDRPGPPASPDEPQPPVPAEEVATLRGWLGGLLPGSHPRPLHGSACFYTMTPDRDFIVGRHPRHDRVAVAAGCSGHGFKFGIALGQALAAIATGQPSPWPVDRFDPGRFALAGGTTGGRHDR